MLLAEADAWTITGISGFVVTVAGLIAAGAVWAVKTKREARKGTMDEWKEIAADQRAQLAQKDVRIATLERGRDSLKQITEEALATIEEMAKRKADAEGKPIAPPLVAVVPERNSPVTKEEQEAADLATARGRMVAASVALGLPPREPGVPETDIERKARLLAERQKAAQEIVPEDTPLRKSMDELPEKTAAKVVEKLDERKEEGGA